MSQPALHDRLGRPLSSLRLSVTDRCNLRCRYCMPEDEYVWLPRESILTFEEMTRLVRIFAGLGVSRLRLTGGEPLLRHDLPDLIAQLSGIPEITDLAMTTNGLLLGREAAALRHAGLQRLTVSIDTLVSERMLRFARSSKLNEVRDGLSAAAAVGFTGTKLNTVVIRGFNHDEICSILRFARERGYQARFIEYMDVGGATRWTEEEVVPQSEILEIITAEFGPVTPVAVGGSAPASLFSLADGTTFGVIASTTAPFCRDCDRSRITADGTWYRCLYSSAGSDMRELLRGGASDAEIAQFIGMTWAQRSDRGAEQRLEQQERGALYSIEGLRADPRLEMHTRGG